LPEPQRLLRTPDKVIPARFEAAVVALEQTLMLKRYSWRTVKAYKNCFRQFIRHYDQIKPSQITRQQECAVEKVKKIVVPSFHPRYGNNCKYISSYTSPLIGFLKGKPAGSTATAAYRKFLPGPNFARGST